MTAADVGVIGTEEVDCAMVIRSAPPRGRALCQKELAVGKVLPQMPSGPVGALAPVDTTLPAVGVGVGVAATVGVAPGAGAAAAVDPATAAGAASNTDRRLSHIRSAQSFGMPPGLQLTK